MIIASGSAQQMPSKQKIRTASNCTSLTLRHREKEKEKADQVIHNCGKFDNFHVSNVCQFLDFLPLVCFSSSLSSACLFSFCFPVALYFVPVCLSCEAFVLRSKQLLDQEEVDAVHPLDKERGITLEDFKLIKMHMANCMHCFSPSCWVLSCFILL